MGSHTSSGECKHLISTASVRARIRQKGFTYLTMLFAVAIAGAVVASGSIIWHQDAQRQRERELLRIGEAFRQAIGRYYERSPGTQKRYPEKLDELLLDLRHLSLQRYMRRIYRDPMTGKTEWGLVRSPSGGIMGVHSLSEARPIRTGGFDGDKAAFNGKTRYAEWQFVYAPPAQPFGSEPTQTSPLNSQPLPKPPLVNGRSK